MLELIFVAKVRVLARMRPMQNVNWHRLLSLTLLFGPMLLDRPQNL
jgi:hypothetical protein